MDGASAISDQAVRPPIERRLAAASEDGLLVGACSALLLLSFGPMWAIRSAWLRGPAAVVLVLYHVVEALTGITPDKWVSGLALRARDGACLR